MPNSLDYLIRFKADIGDALAKIRAVVQAAVDASERTGGTNLLQGLEQSLNTAAGQLAQVRSLTGLNRDELEKLAETWRLVGEAARQAGLQQTAARAQQQEALHRQAINMQQAGTPTTLADALKASRTSQAELQRLTDEFATRGAASLEKVVSGYDRLMDAAKRSTTVTREQMERFQLEATAAQAALERVRQAELASPAAQAQRERDAANTLNELRQKQLEARTYQYALFGKTAPELEGMRDKLSTNAIAQRAAIGAGVGDADTLRDTEEKLRAVEQALQAVNRAAQVDEVKQLSQK